MAAPKTTVYSIRLSEEEAGQIKEHALRSGLKPRTMARLLLLNSLHNSPEKIMRTLLAAMLVQRQIDKRLMDAFYDQEELPEGWMEETERDAYGRAKALVDGCLGRLKELLAQ